MSKISIVVVDDHPLFQQGVIDAFSLEPDFDVIGQAANGTKGLEVIRQLKPSVSVVDVNLPELNGQQITRQVANEKIPTKIILLTAYDDTEQVIHAMRAGASAYCAKDILPEKLVDIVRAVADGKYVVQEEILDDDELEKWLMNQTEQAIRPYSDPGEPFHPLSNREMEVLECVTTGMSNKEIAGMLGISHQTVKNHVTAILRKLGVDDRTQAAVYALRRGWVRLYQQDSESQE
ncbi:MAG: response regulator transcription factor [Anaerolineales bacterium]|nr:response regulator transcription factor [Anaerolineales bacterium]